MFVCHCQRDSYLKEVGCVCVSLPKRQLSKRGRVCLCIVRIIAQHGLSNAKPSIVDLILRLPETNF